ncbi:serpin family protein [Actinophytocola sp. NPDC049390]|uniref:serpin family protein n=1 Tax=Actinophytocola sp. NPDC049390 TaxID=3363894 RepID=UPI00379A5314
MPYRGGRLAFTVIVPAGPGVLRGKGARGATLRAAGMTDAFSTAADFGGITDDAPLHLDSVRHRTFVRVDEEGTEAAAASGGDAKIVSVPVPHTVTVDRPFLFVITDTANGAPLFLGRIGDPTAGVDR